MGYFITIPFKREECAPIDGASRWQILTKTAGAPIGSLPLVVLWAFFVEHYVAAMTGAVKE